MTANSCCDSAPTLRKLRCAASSDAACTIWRDEAATAAGVDCSTGLADWAAIEPVANSASRREQEIDWARMLISLESGTPLFRDEHWTTS
jgi:hypothetical protein